MNENRPRQQTYTVLIELATDTPPDARTLAETLERVLESYPGIGSAVVSAVEGDATHAGAVLARLFAVHKHKH